MNILFLSVGNIESICENGLPTDLLRQFRDNGHNLYIVSTREKRNNLPTKFISEGGVSFLSIKIGNITNTNFIEKGISTMMVESAFLRGIKRYLKHVTFQLIVYSTPPVTFAKAIYYIKERDGAKTYLWLKDIFPQNAVDLNIFNKSSYLYRYFRKKEKKLYSISDFIGCMSQANKDYILKNNPEISRDAAEVCPNCIDPLCVYIDNIRNIEIRSKYGIPHDKTIFIYGGNLGKPQGVDFLIEILKSNKDNNLAYFIIVGSGSEYNKLKNYFDNGSQKNAQLIFHLPKTDYNKLLNACDVGLIFLDKRFTIPNFPSRLLNYMQESMPILAATDVNTDIGRIIEEANFGFWCESKDVTEFNRILEKLYDKKIRQKMGKNSRQYLEDHYTAKHSYDIIMNHFI